MVYKKRTLLLLGLVCLSQSFGDEPKVCSSQHNLNRFSIRHIESKGIGYNQGYTTLEGFFVPLSSLTTKWVPFLDVRGHIFNNAKPAANTGIGLRYIDKRVWGGNIYYDYRKTSHHNYNQISFGLESLGRYLDYRVNGYFPVGSHKSSLYDPHFHSFSGHSLYIARKQELALKGCNGEVGVHIAQVKGIDFYSALGPYYFGNEHKHTFGGEFRLGMDVLGILRLEGNTSYDHLYKWIGQGQISLSYAFTPKTMSRRIKKGSCSFHSAVRDRAFQRVDKQEIVVTSTQQKKSIAINPATGLAYVFWFVDNTSHSQGTYESPFNTLTAAQTASHPNDIIIVFPGDGTSAGMNNGIALQDGQKLWGVSVPHTLSTTLGNIRIRPLASQLPILDDSGLGQNVVTCSNNNDVEGLKIEVGSSGLLPNGIIINGTSNYTISNNIIISSKASAGIYLDQSIENLIVNNNSFIGSDNSPTFGFVGNACSGNITIANNLFGGIAVPVLLDCTGFYTYSIIGNTLNFNPNANNALVGILIAPSSPGGNTQYLIAGNRINNLSNSTLSQIDQLELPSLEGGISIYLDESMFVTLRNNQVTTLNEVTLPSYRFANYGNASSSQINLAPDNVGNFVYEGF